MVLTAARGKEEGGRREPGAFISTYVTKRSSLHGDWMR